MSQDVRIRVRPRRSLIVTGFASIVLVMLPIFGVLYWFAAQHDSVPLVLVVHIALIVIAVLLLLRQLTVDTTVSDTHITGRGIFSPLVRVPLDRISRVDLVSTYVGQDPEPTQQLLLRDAAGKRLYRMRGTFWAPGDLEKVAATLPVTPTIATDPIAIDEFYTTYPGSAYWFENRPVLIAVMVGVAVLLSLATATWVMMVLRLPIGFA